MTHEPIRNKVQMYRLLGAGLLGNTNPCWMSLDAWEGRESLRDWPLWGVRSYYAWDRRMQLDVPLAAVADLTRGWFGSGPVHLSPMVDHMLTLRAEVFEDHHGLRVFGVEGLRDIKWRQAMSEQGREWRGAQARHLLRKHLNPSSLEDFDALMENYPGHVVEITACDRVYGTVPWRNTVIWEVRNY